MTQKFVLQTKAISGRAELMQGVFAVFVGYVVYKLSAVFISTDFAPYAGIIFAMLVGALLFRLYGLRKSEVYTTREGLLIKILKSVPGTREVNFQFAWSELQSYGHVSASVDQDIVILNFVGKINFEFITGGLVKGDSREFYLFLHNFFPDKERSVEPPGTDS